MPAAPRIPGRRVLITRPLDDARALAGLLEARGFRVMVEPLLAIVIRHSTAVPLDGVQGILATSANGVRALAANLPAASPAFALPLWAVGDATARCAGETGFTRVESAGGDVESLAALVRERARPQDGALIHAAGTAVAGDLAGRLGAAGFQVRRLVLYDARAADTFSPELTEALEKRRLDMALFFSPRTAKTFATLARAAGRENCLGGVAALALSAAVARELAVLPWRGIHVAARPDQEALLAEIARLDADAAGQEGEDR